MNWKNFFFSLFLCSFIFLLSIQSFSQNIAISSPLRLTNKAGRFKILGKNQEGILVRIYGKDIEQINVYDDNLNFQSSKSIMVKRNEFSPIGYFLKPSGLIFFYSVSSKKNVYVCSVVINDKFETGPELVLDTIPYDNSMESFKISFSISPNQSKCILYYPIFNSNHVPFYRTLCINNRYELLYVNDIQLLQVAGGNPLQKALVTNEGKSVLVQRSLQGDSNIFKIDQVFYNNSDSIKSYNFSLPIHIFEEPIYDWDEKNNVLRIAGLKSPDKYKDGADGVFHVATDLDSFFSFHIIGFTDSFLNELTGKKKRTDDLLYTFKPKILISRMDGGLVFVTESHYRQDEEYTVPSFNPGMASYRTINVYHYNDIVLFSINANGTLAWTQIIRKSQQSENDNGAYGSFSCLNTNTKLHCIFSSEITSKSFIRNATIAADGSEYSTNLLNQFDSGLMIVPKLGVQISSRDIVIPSFRENDLKIVKIGY